jgi:hypothetical protein
MVENNNNIIIIRRQRRLQTIPADGYTISIVQQTVKIYSDIIKKERAGCKI